MSSPPLNILTREDRGLFCWTPLMDPSRNRSSLRTRFSSRSRPGSETGFLRQDCRRTEWGVYEIVGRMANGKAALRQLLGPQPVTLSHFRTVPAVGSAVRQDSPNFGMSGKEETFNSGHFDRLSDRSPGHQSGNARGTEQDRAPGLSNARFLKEHNCLFYATGLE